MQVHAPSAPVQGEGPGGGALTLDMGRVCLWDLENLTLSQTALNPKLAKNTFCPSIISPQNAPSSNKVSMNCTLSRCIMLHHA